MGNNVIIPPSELEYIVNNMTNLIKDPFALRKTFDKVFIGENNLTYKQKCGVSQSFVKTIIDLIKAEKQNKKYLSDLLVSIQTQYGDVANGNILYHFEPKNKKDILTLLSIPEVKEMIRQNQQENLSLSFSDRLPSVLYPINKYDKNFMKKYQTNKIAEFSHYENQEK